MFDFLSSVGSFISEVLKDIPSTPSDPIDRKLTIDAITSDSIDCKCGNNAIPVYATSNKYYCPSCGSRFSNSPHPLFMNKMLAIKDSKHYYDEYVESIKKTLTP